MERDNFIIAIAILLPGIIAGIITSLYNGTALEIAGSGFVSVIVAFVLQWFVSLNIVAIKRIQRQSAIIVYSTAGLLFAIMGAIAVLIALWLFIFVL